MSCNAKKDPNGTWRIQYRWTDWTGTKKKSQKRGFKTKKEAEEWYAHFMLQQSSDPTMTLADFWEIYKADMEKRLRKTTMKQKEYVMNDKILPYFGKTPINEITAPMIRKWQGEMMDKGFKPTYLKTIHNQLSAILNYAVNFYDLRSNPCRKAGSMGKSKADERPYWTLEEFQKFSDAIMDKQDSWIAFQILFWTGMRIGELLALQVKDIDFEQGTITVDESLTRLDGEDLITAPKTESSVRVITIHKELQEELKEYIATLYHVRPGTRLFAGRTKSFFEHEMERGIKLSGVKKITVHCTRHSHASMLVQMGFSPVEIAKRLGHGKVDQFKFLRDGGDYIEEETGQKKHFDGQLFDPIVFDDSVKEFLALKKKLANYFDEKSVEDIFDYIPPQKTNQIFTPKIMVKKMVDMLEQENPGCFDMPDKTFIDLYMKSGLYIAEIVKRLYQSEKMKKQFPDNKERLKHIFEKQVYGLAPTEIIYKIATSYILGFDEDTKDIKHNFKQLDALPYAKDGTLGEVLDELYSEQQ